MGKTNDIQYYYNQLNVCELLTSKPEILKSCKHYTHILQYQIFNI